MTLALEAALSSIQSGNDPSNEVTLNRLQRWLQRGCASVDLMTENQFIRKCRKQKIYRQLDNILYIQSLKMVKSKQSQKEQYSNGSHCTALWQTVQRINR